MSLLTKSSKRPALAIICIALAMLLSVHAQANDTLKKTLGGAAAGALIGAAMDGSAGAVKGAAIGGGAGLAIGVLTDDDDKKRNRNKNKKKNKKRKKQHQRDRVNHHRY